MDWQEWLKANDELLAWLGGFSLLFLVGSLLAVPLVVALMPEDYLLEDEEWRIHRNPLNQILHLLKNFLGLVLVLAGVLMLVLPGQGILTIVIGLSLIDFPGKRRLQIRLVRIRRVKSSVAWIRKKAGRKPLRIPDPPRSKPSPAKDENDHKA